MCESRVLRISFMILCMLVFAIRILIWFFGTVWHQLLHYQHGEAKNKLDFILYALANTLTATSVHINKYITTISSGM